jgi:hypothetical protein
MLNNNRFKSELIEFIGKENIQLISFKELQIVNLNCSNFEIVIKSNRSVMHTIKFDYHLQILNIDTNINGSNLTAHTYDSVHMIIDFSNKIRKEIGYLS